MSFGWNPWHGCRKVSEGCRNCYVYGIDAQYGRDASCVYRTAEYDLPLRRARSGAWKLTPGRTVYTCFSSDFLLEEADAWRDEAWRMMRVRGDLHFLFVTKRIDRLAACVPDDWGPQGYGNVTVCCTVENQEQAEQRLPVYCAAPLRRRIVVCEPLLGPVDLTAWLNGIDEVSVGGESGPSARMCDYAWVVDLQRQCRRAGVAFRYRQTGALLRREGRVYRIPRSLQRVQARRAGIDFTPPDSVSAHPRIEVMPGLFDGK